MYRLLSDLFFGQGFGAVFGEFLECRGYTIAIYEIVFLNKVLEELTFVYRMKAKFWRNFVHSCIIFSIVSNVRLDKTVLF